MIDTCENVKQMQEINMAAKINLSEITITELSKIIKNKRLFHNI